MDSIEPVEHAGKSIPSIQVEFNPHDFDLPRNSNPCSKMTNQLPEISLVQDQGVRAEQASVSRMNDASVCKLSDEFASKEKFEPFQSRAGKKSGTDIVSATNAYEKWAGEKIKLLPEDLAKKHSDMASDPFEFMRGTYYRWAEEYPKLLPELAQAPKVNSVGDLHVENFGTWSDAKARTIWGVNDFDEAYQLPYTNDLVRLVTSANLLIQSGQLKTGLKEAAADVLDGYTQALKDGGKPFVISEPGSKIGELADEQTPKTGKFWHKLDAQIAQNPESNIPAEALAALKSIMPDADMDNLQIGHRQAGVGSLGRERFAATSMVDGEEVAAEVKSVLPSANSFVKGENERSYYNDVMRQAVRVQDPLVEAGPSWVARSLSPSQFRIELADLSNSKDEKSLLWAMGYEAANIHLGSQNAAPEILADLQSRDQNWLTDAAKTMTRSIVDDQKEWKNSQEK